jgi:hypothetical protein
MTLRWMTRPRVLAPYPRAVDQRAGERVAQRARDVGGVLGRVEALERQPLAARADSADVEAEGLEGLRRGRAELNQAGEYQGVFAIGEAPALLAAPALMTTLVAGWGRPGWLVLAAIFLAPAAAAVPVTRWALRTPGRAGPIGAARA